MNYGSVNYYELQVQDRSKAQWPTLKCFLAHHFLITKNIALSHTISTLTPLIHYLSPTHQPTYSTQPPQSNQTNTTQIYQHISQKLHPFISLITPYHLAASDALKRGTYSLPMPFTCRPKISDLRKHQILLRTTTLSRIKSMLSSSEIQTDLPLIQLQMSRSFALHIY